MEEGRVVAIDCDTVDGPQRFRARGGIVLATGDFTSDLELKARLRPAGSQDRRLLRISPRPATGRSSALARRASSMAIWRFGLEFRFVPPQRKIFCLACSPWPALANLDGVVARPYAEGAAGWPFVMSFVTTALAPSPDLFVEGALLINKRGERFTDELDRPAYALPEQPDKVGYILLDKRMADLFSGWPHFVSTAPGVAYAYVDDYRRNRALYFSQDATLRGAGGKTGDAGSGAHATPCAHNAHAGQSAAAGRGALRRARAAARGVRACRRRAGSAGSRECAGRPAPRP